jgi:hypothetical protein
LKTVAKYNAQVNSGRYIVTLKQGVSRASFLQSVALSSNSSVTHKWDVVHNGFAGNFI